MPELTFIPSSQVYAEPRVVTWEQLTAALRQFGLCAEPWTYQGTAGQLLQWIADHR
jgi:hypothetical protein